MITRRARASRVTLLASVPLLALVTLAAGCGTVSTPTSAAPAGAAGSTHPSASGAATSPATNTTTAPPAPATPTPVPTTTGGTFTPGVPACTGWPGNAAREKLPASFTPVAVLRCVSAEQKIPGKGNWLTETLERADNGLGPLVTALREPSGPRKPGIMCPDLAMVPPQIALIGADGTKIIPRLPLSGCGLVETRVLGALATLSWDPVSVRMITQVK